ncbi:hypothetical protein COHA_003906 [Chlorella ohadii]|uniref:Uncharacterized protein n=1 Tax=Chlorella ohadii TaxID=2649997 RepID=A0AAD5DUD3_9CHLO|nr:hypothetical protein COHA_003906 [Chlorella ohadii]
MEEAARVLLVPIFRRHWLWYAWGGRTAAAAVEAGRAAAAAVKPPRDWRQGVNLEEKAHLLSQLARSWVQRRLWSEWHKLETAREGTMRNRGFKMAQAVLAREDPRETFLKNLPAKAAPVEVVYPTAFREKLVRRRLRHVCADSRRRHTTRLMWWVLALVPQLPLMLTPLPNITVYYTGYRIYSHYRALQGCKALEECLEQLNSKQLRTLRDELLLLQEQTPGLKYPRDEWPSKLIRREHRGSSPLGDEAAMKIGRLFGQPSMMELVARARKRAVGSMFPSIFPEAGGSGRQAGPRSGGT